MMDGDWQHDKGIKLKRFEDYGAGPKANLDAVELTIVPSTATTELDGFANGLFDWARVPTDQVSQQHTIHGTSGDWIAKKTAATTYLLVMVTKAPLDTPKARKAISLAIDRAKITTEVLKGALPPANQLIPSAIKDAYQPGVCEACEYDPEQAKKLAKEAGTTPGTSVKVQFNTGDGHEERTGAVKRQLETNLGLKIDYSGIPVKDLLTNEQASGATGLYRASWGADWPAASQFLTSLLSCQSIGTTDPAASVTGDNRGRYCNKDFDNLLSRAERTQDEHARNDLYKQAERMAIGDDLALIPMFAREQFRLCKTTWANCQLDFFENPTLDLISLK